MRPSRPSVFALGAPSLCAVLMAWAPVAQAAPAAADTASVKTPAAAAPIAPHHRVRPRHHVAAAKPPLALTPSAPVAVPATAELDDEAPPPPPPKRLAHEVPNPDADDAYEVPIAWVLQDGRPHHRAQALSLDVGIWPNAFSLGAWYSIPVLPKGFIRHVNDSLDVEFGLLLGAMQSNYYWNDGSTSWQLWPAGGVRWNFYMTPNWTTFATLKLAGRIGVSGNSPGWFDVLVGAGATYRIKNRVHLRLELNYPQGAVVGVLFPLGALD